MRLRNRLHLAVPAISLLVFFGSMLSSVLIDLDHPLALALGIADQRFLHVPVFCFLGAGVALVGGLLAYRARVHEVDWDGDFLNEE